MEMLAANKMNLRRIFAAGWQEGESDAGEGDNRSSNRVVGEVKGRKGKGEATSLALLMHQSLAWADDKKKRGGGGSGEEFRINNVRETCHAMESKRH